MADYAIRLPDVGEGVAEAELVEWLVKIGDEVREDDVLAIVMTDKASVEVPTPVDGKVVWLAVRPGESVAVGADLVRLQVADEELGDDDGERGTDDSETGDEAENTPRPAHAAGARDAAAGDIASSRSASSARDEAALPTGRTRRVEQGKRAEQGNRAEQRNSAEPSSRAELSSRAESASRASLAQRSRSQPDAPASGAAAPRGVAAGGPAILPRARGEKPIASPAVRARAREAGIDLRRVPGSGPAGRITHEDLDRLFERGPQAQVAETGLVPDVSVEEIKLVGLRRRIAEKMTLAHARIADMTYVEELDVTELETLRTALNAKPRGDVRLTLLPFLMRAIARAVGEQPMMNAHFDDEQGVLRRYGGVHVGIATQTPSGLVVPVVRHVEARDLRSCAAEVARLAEAARSGTATRDELVGSTITITSLGAMGGIVTTPVINHPEVAIVGVNRIVVRPLWDGSRFVPRKTMNLSCSFDHRVVDGWDAAVFVQRIKSLLETPAMLFVQA